MRKKQRDFHYSDLARQDYLSMAVFETVDPDCGIPVDSMEEQLKDRLEALGLELEQGETHTVCIGKAPNSAIYRMTWVMKGKVFLLGKKGRTRTRRENAIAKLHDKTAIRRQCYRQTSGRRVSFSIPLEDLRDALEIDDDVELVTVEHDPKEDQVWVYYK